MRPTESEPRPAATGAALTVQNIGDATHNGDGVQVTGDQLKTRALAGLGARHRDDILRAQRAMIRVLLERREGTVEDVRAGLNLPDAARTKWLGAAVAELRRAGIIRHAGWVESSRPVAHARPISLWALADSSAALTWLAEHPEPPSAANTTDGQGLLFGGAVP